MSEINKNIIPHSHALNMDKRNAENGHKSLVLWFTGYSGSGKSTIADRAEQMLMEKGLHTYLLDGDNVRVGLNKDLDFSEASRTENIRRIAEVSKLFIDAGIIVLSAFVSPLISDREMVKSIVGNVNFVEIFINTSIEECERRDVKGLYKKARNGEIKDFTGISAPYEAPVNPDIEIKTEFVSIDESATQIVNYLFETLNVKL